MLRRLLSIYLAILMAATPCLCCCTFGRAMAVTVVMPVESQSSCCCHEESQLPTPAPSTPDSPDRCPCREHAEKQALASPAIDPIATRTLWPSTALDFAAIVLPVGGPSAIALFGPLQPCEPYPSTADLLHSHHRLRC